MVKRKATAPQRLGLETRSTLTWDMNTPEVDNIYAEQECETPSKKIRKKNVKQCDLVDKCLERMVSECSFYIGIKKDLSFMKNTAIYLGNVSLPIKSTCSRLPEDGEFWLYINENTPRSFLYIESATGVEYYFVNGALNYELFEGLALRCFTLMLEDTNSFSKSHSLNIRVFLNESFCRPCNAYLDIRPRNSTQSFQAVVSYFYGIKTPVFEKNKEMKKHDIDILYNAVKEFHSKDICDKSFIQHPSLVPTLRPYQGQAVQWMLRREDIQNDVNKVSDQLHILYDEILTPEHRTLYYNKYSGHITLEKPVALGLPTGGILADEMGLGKTVEVLACMLANPRSEKDIKEDIEKRARMSVENESHKTSAKSNDSNTVITEHEKSHKTESEINAKSSEEVNSSEIITGTENACKVLLEANTDSEVAGNVQISACGTEKATEIVNSSEHILKTEDAYEVLSEKNIGCEVAANVQISAMGESSQGTENSLFSQSIQLLEESAQKVSEIVDRVEEISTETIYQEKISKPELPLNIKKEEKIKNFKNKVRTNTRRRRNTEITVKTTDSVLLTIETVISKFCYNGKRFGEPQVKRKSEVRTALEKWYTEMLSSTKPLSRPSIKKETGPTFECVCGFGDDFERKTVCCSGCNSWQHAACMGLKQEDSNRMTHCYFCPRCWQSQDPVVSGGTLIVSPASISNQWINEIKKHIREENLSILVYKGMQKHGFFQPEALAKYHIVITTYETLRREMNYADLNGTDGRRLRHAKRFLAPPSPLPCVQWWRLCLDEAQMVEGTNRTAEMTRRLAAVHRWAITGTPVQKSIHDLFGLVQFLNIDPYCDLRWWQDLIYYPYINGNPGPLYKLMGDIMWRTSKKDVLNQINIPEQSEVVEWLNFSPVEEYFYKQQHQECSASFIAGLSKMKSLDITLDSLHRHTITKILAPLLKLRQACSHPQAVRGKFITSAKATMSMEELLESLIKKTKHESEEALRQNIAALNGLAAINIIKENWSEAVEIYREVLRISDQYKEKLKIDKLQMIHTLHNLADILEGRYTAVPPTLHDDTLREDAIALEKKYMLKINSQLTSQQETLAGLSVAVTELENGFQIGHDIWWVELLSWLSKHGEEAELISKIRDDLEEKKLPGQESIKNRLTRIVTLECELSKWNDLVPKFRTKCVKNLRTLEATSREDLVNGAVDCHLRLSMINNKNKKRCKLCSYESELKKYESLIFAVSKKETEHSMVGNVLVLGQLNQGTWKPSEMERALRVIVTFGRSKRADKVLLDDGNLHLKLLDAMKKEFKQLRLVWAHLGDQVSAQDELNMAKLRLRIRYPDEPVPQKNKQRNPLHQLSSNVGGNAVETIHIIERHQVNGHAARLESEKVVAQGELRRKTGQLLYLENLRKSQGLNRNPDPCPVCQTNLGDKWCVLQCGHCYCLECIRFLIEQNIKGRRLSVKCPVCRDSTVDEHLSYVNLRCKASNAKEDEEGITVKGSYSTKVEAVIYRLLALRAADPSVKALVFSSWEKVLEVLAFALKENGITFARLQPGVTYHMNLQNFKDMKQDITALLLPVRWGAKGLNLTEATHVLLVEPILNPADELQAIGRVHRIGQTKRTVIHRFLIRGTVEERMYTAVRSSGVEKWSGDRVTLRQLQDLFTASYKDSDEAEKDNNASSISDDLHMPSSSHMSDNA